MKWVIKTTLATMLIAASAFPALAEVRIGKGVRIGGNEVAPQTFTEERNGIFYIYEENPKNPGCRWRKNADGSQTKICHLKRKN